MKKIFQLALAAIPLVVAIYVDHGLVSDVHFALIGIVAICVALCDSLFGQVLANTKWIPFCACHSPREAEELVYRFHGYHNRLFLRWMLSKFCNSIAIILAALFAMQRTPKLLAQYHMWCVGIGYVALGTSIIMTIQFVITYHQAVKESDRVKLMEMNFAYEKDHPDLFSPDEKKTKQQLKGFANGFNSAAQTAHTVN